MRYAHWKNSAILFFLVAFTLWSQMPSGHVLRPLAQLGDSWASNIIWLPGDSSAVWLEHPPNASFLSRLIYWDEQGSVIMLPAGASDFAVGTFDSNIVIVMSSYAPDSSGWQHRRIMLCYPPQACREISIPVGNLSGIARWDGSSDTIFYALCTKPDDEPMRFYTTFDGTSYTMEGSLPLGFEFPIGCPPEDTLPDCYNALFAKTTSPSVEENTTLSGSVSQHGLGYHCKKNKIIISDESDSSIFPFPNTVDIVEVAWTSDGKRALVATVGKSNCVWLFVPVWADD